jgi:oxalate decarboxylase/phosphoglucose isomerase-like protein (cupin superfamily)
MTDGLILPPGAGQRIEGTGTTLLLGAEQTERWSFFEADVPPGFDVGAHFHREAEEVFYVLEGELDLLAFEPADETAGDWRGWQSRTGARVTRGRPGTFMYVPAGCPHAFANPGSTIARMLFVVAPSGHERYLRELAEMGRGGSPDPAAFAALNERYDIGQLTPMVRPHRH